MAAVSSELRVMERNFPQLLGSLNVDEIKPYLIADGVISLTECEELTIGPHLATRRALAEKTLCLLARNPSNCVTHLISAMEQSEKGRSPQQAHHGLISDLRKDIEAYKCCDVADVPWRKTLANGISEPTTQDWPSPPQYNGAANEPIPLIDYNHAPSGGAHENLKVALVEESRKIMEQFTSFVLKVDSLLRSKPDSEVTAQQLKLALMFRIGSKNIGKESLRRIEEENSIYSVLVAAEPFSSWYNYDLIAYLSRQFGGTEGYALVSQYESLLEQYLKKLVFECPPFSGFQSRANPNDFEQLEVKLDWDFNQVTVQDISIFKEKLCKFCKCDASLFVLKSVDDGCVRITWLIPFYIVDDISTILSNYDHEQLARGIEEDRIVSLGIGSSITVGLKVKPTVAEECGTCQSSFNNVGTPCATIHESFDKQSDDGKTMPLQSRELKLHPMSKQLKSSKPYSLSPPVPSPHSELPQSPLVQAMKLSTEQLESSTNTGSSNFAKVKLRDTKARQCEWRWSSGYYSPAPSAYNSPIHSQRSSMDDVSTDPQTLSRLSQMQPYSEYLEDQLDSDGEEVAHATMEQTLSSSVQQSLVQPYSDSLPLHEQQVLPHTMMVRSVNNLKNPRNLSQVGSELDSPVSDSDSVLSESFSQAHSAMPKQESTEDDAEYYTTRYSEFTRKDELPKQDSAIVIDDERDDP